jgi:transcriptional antiterminator RfaH
MEHWYTLYTKPRQEARVARRLNDLDVETFLPLLKRAQSAGHPKSPAARGEAFFPCYLFANLDLEALPAASWQWIPGLRRIVSFGGAPAPVPEAAVGLIRDHVARLNAGGPAQRSRFRPGDPVRIASGPMADMVALFERECGPEERVSVLLTFLGRTCRLEIDAAALETSGRGPLPTDARPPRRTRGHGRPIRIHSPL